MTLCRFHRCSITGQATARGYRTIISQMQIYIRRPTQIVCRGEDDKLRERGNYFHSGEDVIDEEIEARCLFFSIADYQGRYILCFGQCSDSLASTVLRLNTWTRIETARSSIVFQAAATRRRSSRGSDFSCLHFTTSPSSSCWRTCWSPWWVTRSRQYR